MTRDPGNSTECEGIRPLLERYASVRLDAGDERRVRTHLARCHACRSFRAADGDPGALFLELRSRPLPEAQWAGFMEGLRARLERDGGESWRRRWIGWNEMLRYPRLAYVAAPLAMVLVLGATLLVMRPEGRDLLSRMTRIEGIRSPYDRPVDPTRRRPAVPRPERLPSAVSLTDALAEPPGPPALEEVVSPGARVYRFDLGGDDDEMPIYLVVDESIDF